MVPLGFAALDVSGEAEAAGLTGEARDQHRFIAIEIHDDRRGLVIQVRRYTP